MAKTHKARAVPAVLPLVPRALAAPRACYSPFLPRPQEPHSQVRGPRCALRLVQGRWAGRSFAFCFLQDGDPR
jgi:hypothetical protein